MNSSQRYLLFILLALTGGSLIVFAAFYSVYSPAFKPLPPREGTEIKYPLPAPAPRVPGFHITKKDRNTFVVTWENLPEDTSILRLYRTPKKGGEGSLWKEIPIPPGAAGGGSAEVKLGPGENPDNFEYHAEGVSGGGTGTSTGGTVTWTSSSTVPEVPAPVPTSTPTSTPPSGGGSTGQAQPPSGQNPTSTPTSTPSSPPSSENSTGTVYYTPDGQISTTTQPSAANFGVQHTNRNIEIYWQALPSATDQIVIYRSSGSDGPWSQLLAQGSPNRVKGSIFLVDYSIDQGFHYRMEARGAGSLIAAYGPAYLPPLE